MATPRNTIKTKGKAPSRIIDATRKSTDKTQTTADGYHFPTGLIETGKPQLDPRLKKSTVLWRYMDAAKFFSLIDCAAVDRGAIPLCRGDIFEDKFEGAFTRPLKALVDNALKGIDSGIDFETFKRRLRESVFISSWHASSRDSMAMWRIYGGSKCAVAVTTTVGQLEIAMQEAKLPHELAISKVDYVEHWESPDLCITPYSRVFTYKVKAYAFEKEVRLIIDRYQYPAKHHVPIAEKTMLLPIKLKPTINSIVVSPEAPEWFMRLIMNTARRLGMDERAVRSKLALAPETEFR